MTWTSSKGYLAANAYPRALSRIAISVGLLALFLVLGSWVLLSNPVGSPVSGSLYSIDSSQKSDSSVSTNNQTTRSPSEYNVAKNVSSKSYVQGSPSDLQTKDVKDQVPLPELFDKSFSNETSSQVPLTSKDAPNTLSDVEKIKEVSTAVPVPSFVSTHDDGVNDVTPLLNDTDNDQTGNSISKEFVNKFNFLDLGTNESRSASSGSSSGDSKAVPTFTHDSNLPNNASRTDSGCDLYQGNWIYDSLGPLYTNNKCPILTQMQNCQGNGRPDKDYENWRWKPSQCDLPRFDARKFLNLMRGKTIAFVGDSVARNQMESLLCILWQEEAPKNRGNRKMQRYYFKSTSVMVVRIWSSWLVKQTTQPVDIAPESVVKLHLDAPDENLMQHIPNFDVVVLSSGHWFAKQSVYLMNHEIVGGQLWWPDKSRHMKINNIQAFGISVETILTAFGTHPNYTGLTIVRSFSPDHYEGGAWNTGGSCTGKTKPLGAGEVVENGFTNIMHEKQVSGFYRAVKKITNKSKMRLMDITRVFEYRHDGHPGPYRNTNPNKLTTRGSDGKPPPQDCLHWCMPGPVDTWNELVLELIGRDHESNTSLQS
ncbi:protein trichome birefringence-like 18 [Humulus lupulus]|uniref:protein trichome birefringence-like 18 n=1 Tax=Humulus lupulus TaxID=3486 RepID=UPI002B415D9F|nr:protein trichome birefringence-like 18 [Humulus lupulus]XP_062073302.1 protein trichome birefringence-like 18 [Humulus lupulus]